jgi:hypothetical protein
LNQNNLETSVSKRLSDAGFTVHRNSDEDTYVYVNIITTSLSTGLCVSRYDVILYTHTTAKLSYQQTPVLVEVSLLHKGGIAGGAPAAHAESVLRACWNTSTSSRRGFATRTNRGCTSRYFGVRAATGRQSHGGGDVEVPPWGAAASDISHVAR